MREWDGTKKRSRVMRDYNIVSKYKMNSQQTGGGHVTVNEGPFPNEETWPSGSCLGP